MNRQVIIVDVKCQPYEAKIQFEEGAGPYKLAAIAQNLEVVTRVFQDHLFEADPVRLAGIIRELKTEQTILAFSLLTNGLRQMLEIIRLTSDLHLPVIIGGAGATIDALNIMEKAAMILPNATPLALVEGDGEQAFEQLLKANPAEWKEYEEVWRRDDNGNVLEGCFLQCEISASPIADLSASDQRKYFFERSEDTGEHWKFRYDCLRALTNCQLECGKGCYYRCGFCNTSSLSHQDVRKKPAEQVVEEMLDLHRRFGITFFSFTDNVAFDRASYWHEFAAKLARYSQSPHIFFGGYSVPHFMASQEWLDDLLPELYRAGLRSIILGVQAGSRRILEEIIRRPADDPSDALVVTKRGVELGINVKADFIIGHPTETIVDLEDTYRCMRGIIDAGGEAFVRKLNVVPHSRYDRQLKSGEFSLPEENSQWLFWERKIIALKRDDSQYRSRVLSVGQPIPNKYLIDRASGLIYPHLIFPTQQLIEARDNLTESGIIASAKSIYAKMFDLIIENRK